jgi:hypothetical protein
MEKAPVAFIKRQLVCQYTLQEDTHPVMTGHIGSRD